MHSREVADALKDIYLTITADQLIPYIRSKLKNSPSLQQYFNKHQKKVCTYSSLKTVMIKTVMIKTAVQAK